VTLDARVRGNDKSQSYWIGYRLNSLMNRAATGARPGAARLSTLLAGVKVILADLDQALA